MTSVIFGVLKALMNIKSFFKNKEVKNAGWIIGGRVAQMALSLVVGILTARYLGPSNYGLIGYGSAYLAFFSALCSLGLNSVIVKELIDHPDEQGEAIGTAIALRLVSSFLSVLMIYGIVSVLDRDEPLTIAVTFLCSIGTFFSSFDMFNYWFQYQYRSKVSSLASLCSYIITSTYKILLLIFGKDVRWFAFATSIDYIVVAILLWAAYARSGGKKLCFSFKKARSMLSVSYNYILSSMMVAIYGHTDKLMLKQMLDSSQVGYYNTAVAVCAMWTFILYAVIDSMTPTILQLKSGEQSLYERKNRQLYAVVFYMSVAVSLVFLVFGKWIILILYGKAYMDAVPILKIITWYTAFSFLGVARNAWIVSEGMQRYLKYMYFMAAVLNVVLNLLLIPHWGASGAAFASLITQVFTGIILPLFIKDLRPNAKLMIDSILLKGVF